MNLLRIDAVEAKTGLDRVTIWRLERGGKFPRRRKVSERAVRWLEWEIDQWMEGLPFAELAASA
jgi:prophage regulatory protein